MEKNEEYIGIVEKTGSNGEGILKNGDYTVFVPYALPEEKIKYKVLKVKKNICFAKLVELYVPSEERVRPKCRVYEKCGGCQLQHLKYKHQLILKRKIVKDCLSKIAFLDEKVMPTVPSELEYGYRNKLQLPIRTEKNGIAIGFFAQNSHRIVQINDCPIQPWWCGKIIKIIRKYIDVFDVTAYSEESKCGLLKHVVVRDVDGKLIITVVINGNELPQVNRLVDLLSTEFNEFSLFVNINKDDTNVIFGKEFKCVYGRKKIVSSDMGVKFEIGPESFMQVNDLVRRNIYREAVKAADPDPDTVVIDAYSGAGLLTAIFATRAKKAVGIEIVKEAVDCADELKKLNGLDEKMENICAPCEVALPVVMERERLGGTKFTLILDPPRQGVDEKLISAIKTAMPERIVYISCSPQTLSRDLGLLSETLVREDGELKKSPENGEFSKYKIEYVKPFDMFPQTRHVETLVVLSHKKPDSHLEVKIDFDNTSLDKTAISERAEKRKPQEKTTYKKIQEWIEENYGFKVHTAYVAEVKRELGLPMYDAPNAVEELKRPRSHPTEEMTIAIKAALKHFEII